MRKSKEDGGGTAFADYVWKPYVLIEMKKRGVDLSRHYRQAFDYWTRLVPGRPRYAVLCNFDEFWVYDFETQMDTPVDQLPLAELPQRWGPLAFLLPSHDRPVFGNDQEQVTRDAADKLERGADYVNAVRKTFPDVPGMADYCVYWFRLAHEHLPACTVNDPVAGRAGLVGTQNVRNNNSREGGLAASAPSTARSNSPARTRSKTPTPPSTRPSSTPTASQILAPARRLSEPLTPVRGRPPAYKAATSCSKSST
ncbi:MAG: hypothetical protein CHACPFDD_01978 [Phycisphaerae bacterium]|nr:hypothetical protein [Phycisphaerae bacterium]